MDFTLLCCYVSIALIPYILYKLSSFFKDTSHLNPFSKDETQKLRERVFDQKKRDIILKQGFNIQNVPQNLDAIVIGSGIGGLSTAALLSKLGKKVLILEQHDQAGGCCHSYIEKGYEFDVGIHYIGDMIKPSITKTLLDQISEGQIVWEEMADDFDHVLFKEPNKKIREYTFVSDTKRQKDYLKKHFPKEADAIDKFYDLVKEVSQGYRTSLIVKFLPLWLVQLLEWTNLIKYTSNFWYWNKRTVKEVVQELISDGELQDLLSYCFGDYGSVPSRTGFPLQSMLLDHFSKGAAYPIGGASEIAHSIIPVIAKSGGEVMVRAKVEEIVISSGEAVGVKVKHGTKVHDIFAPLIISNAGVYNTFERLLPKHVATKANLWPFVKKTPHGMGSVNLFVGIDAPAKDLGIAEKKNLWVFTKGNIDKTCLDYLSLSKDEFEDADLPLMFFSFPSTKDPTWEERYPGKTTLVCVTFANYEWYTDWESKPCKRRGDDYESMKKTMTHKILEHAFDLFPKMRDHIEYTELGSPLSNNHYLGAMKGEIYGLDHDQSRFAPMTYAKLRPKTDIPGLYLTGQDVASCGFTGALYGGLISAQQILGRNLMKDLIKLHTNLHGKSKTN